MKKHGKVSVFTNKYTWCRTVKCYSRNAEDQGMCREIWTTLRSMGIEPAVKRTPGSRYGAPGLIYRLPL
jgi:hypothetical protein